MKKNLWLVLVALGAISLNTSCSKKEGCTDKNGNNFDADAEKNSGCVYRYASTVDISGVPVNNPAGDAWDSDGSAPDLKINFGKSTSSAFDYTTDIKNDVSAATLTPVSNIQFTNEEWKYELVDDDLLSASEVIASGTFNPVTQGSSGGIPITNGTVYIKFNYTVQ